MKDIVFDMDGVLVNSERAMRRAAIEALAGYGIESEEKDFFPFTGMGEDMFIGGVARLHGHEYTTEMKDRAYAIYCARAPETVEVCRGVREALLRLKAQGRRLAVASAADIVKVEANIRVIGLKPSFFDALVTGCDVTRKKPAPDAFLLAAARMGADPASCLVFEDAIGGIQAAVAAGMFPVGVTTTFPEAELRAAGAKLILDGVADYDGD